MPTAAPTNLLSSCPKRSPDPALSRGEVGMTAKRCAIVACPPRRCSIAGLCRQRLLQHSSTVVQRLGQVSDEGDVCVSVAGTDVLEVETAVALALARRSCQCPPAPRRVCHIPVPASAKGLQRAPGRHPDGRRRPGLGNWDVRLSRAVRRGHRPIRWPAKRRKHQRIARRQQRRGQTGRRASPT
jgi:hypothetical protein